MGAPDRLMRIRVLGCSGGSAPGAHPSCYLFEHGVAVDAGALAARLTLAEQRGITHVFVTHSHWDHVRDLPLTTINRPPETPTLSVHGLPQTIEALRTHLMNDVMWFPAFDLPSADTPYVAPVEIAPGETREAGGYVVTAVPMQHSVPAVGYLVDDGAVSVLMCADTVGGGACRDLPGGASPLAAVFIETSFPNRLRAFAEMTGHLTPEMMAAECAHLPAGVQVFTTHMKPGFEAEITAEVAALGRPGMRPAVDGEELII